MLINFYINCGDKKKWVFYSPILFMQKKIKAIVLPPVVF